MKTPLAISSDLIIRQLELAPMTTQMRHELPHISGIRLQPEHPLGAEHIAHALKVTETEARLALTLTHGKTIKDFARAQGCTWHTARTHARNLLAKTGCHRQVEVTLLVRELLG